MSSRTHRTPVALGLVALSTGVALSLPVVAATIGTDGVQGGTIDPAVTAVTAPVGALNAALGNSTNAIGTFH
jgi:hypothetical protein